jgi:hypothetical protein
LLPRRMLRLRGQPRLRPNSHAVVGANLQRSCPTRCGLAGPAKRAAQCPAETRRATSTKIEDLCSRGAARRRVRTETGFVRAPARRSAARAPREHGLFARRRAETVAALTTAALGQIHSRLATQRAHGRAAVHFLSPREIHHVVFEEACILSKPIHVACQSLNIAAQWEELGLYLLVLANSRTRTPRRRGWRRAMSLSSARRLVRSETSSLRPQRAKNPPNSRPTIPRNSSS